MKEDFGEPSLNVLCQPFEYRHKNYWQQIFKEYKEKGVK